MPRSSGRSMLDLGTITRARRESFWASAGLAIPINKAAVTVSDRVGNFINGRFLFLLADFCGHIRTWGLEGKNRLALQESGGTNSRGSTVTANGIFSQP